MVSKKLLTKGNKCEISPDFEYNGEVILGNNVKIGQNVQFLCEKIEIEDNCEVSQSVNIQGGYYKIGKNTRIRPFVRFNVIKKCAIGEYSKIGCYWNISGRDITIGTHLWCVDGDFFGNGIIGGGSEFDVHSKLIIGDHCHLGLYTYINTARLVKIGNNVGFGFRSMIFTHGAWQNMLEGYPVQFAPVIIEDNAWLPTNVLVMPGVTVGEGATIGSGSVVTRNIPARCLAVGVPAKIIKDEKSWPNKLSIDQKNKIIHEIINTWKAFIEDAGFKIIEFLEKPNSIKISLRKEKKDYFLIYFIEKGEKPNFEENSNSVILTFDESYQSQEVDKILFLKSYAYKTFRKNPVGDHIENFLRRRGIKFFLEKRVEIK